MLTRLLPALGLCFLFLPSFVRADGLLIQSGQKLAFLGDSITEQGGYIKLVTAGLDTLGVKIVPIPAGVSGNKSDDMLARLTRDVLSKKPDWMTLSCGVNDVWHGAKGIELAPYEANITSIVDQCQAAGIKVMIMTATVIGEDDNENNRKLVAYNDFLRQLAKDRNLPLADESAAFQAAIRSTPRRADLPGVLTQDGVHPLASGVQVLAKTIIEAFGAPPEQITKVQEAWLDLPNCADLGFRIEFHGGGITLRQYQTVLAQSAKQGMSYQNFANPLFLEAIQESLKAHEHDQPPATNERLEQEAQKRLTEKIDALPKN